MTYTCPWRDPCQWSEAEPARSVTRVGVRSIALFGLIFCNVGLCCFNQLLNNIKISDGRCIMNSLQRRFVSNAVCGLTICEDFDEDGLPVGDNPNIVVFSFVLKCLCIHVFEI